MKDKLTPQYDALEGTLKTTGTNLEIAASTGVARTIPKAKPVRVASEAALFIDNR